MKVLVVDDDELVRYALTEKLGEFGFSVTVACDGYQAVEEFEKGGIDAVLLDLKMPGRDGIETLKELRRRDPDAAVIMLTACGDIPTAVEAIKVGAYDFVEKPPQISRIVLTLRRAVEKYELERTVRRLGKTAEETEALREAYEKLKELDRMKTVFLTSVSHELRTPLTSILGYAKVARRRLGKALAQADDAGPGTEARMREVRRAEENMAILESEAERLTGLIDNILDITELEAGQGSWPVQRLSLREVVEEAAAAASGPCGSKGLALEISIEGELPEVTGSRERLAQALSHLLSNAVKFTHSGTVSISAKREGGAVSVSVKDTGAGMETKDAAMVFEPFRQLGDPLTGKPQGAGLGLPLCRRIVERHGGTIRVKSEPGRGSLFTVVLPAAAQGGDVKRDTGCWIPDAG